MKTLIITAILAITLISCNNKNNEKESSKTETSTNSNELFACSMHPEVTGKKGENCSKCGMELTETLKPYDSFQKRDLNSFPHYRLGR